MFEYESGYACSGLSELFNLLLYMFILQMQVRASDVRVSERVCMSSITLERYATVYNDLTEEVRIYVYH